ncbi:MAG TPA: ShlB/FhaC/HecB family hemolysin secretion/activation protein [Coleofasciculaceae cyanobacterium]
MTCVAKKLQLHFTSLVALLATLWVSVSVKAQTPLVSQSLKLHCTLAGDWRETKPPGHTDGLDYQTFLLTSPTCREGLEDKEVYNDILSFTVPTPEGHLAQVPDQLPGDSPSGQLVEPRPPDIFQPSPSAPPQPQTPQPLPPPEQLLEPSAPNPTNPDEPSTPIQETITVQEFKFVGSTVFSDEQLAKVTEPFTKRPITFAELLSARTAVTTLYTSNGYVTSGAFIPPQTLTSGTVTIQIVEGGLEDIQVNGLRRLRSGYVRSRLALATGKPLNVPRLLEALRLLQLDPLISRISAELSTGSSPGTSLLIVDVAEANTWSYQLFANNGRSPSVGSFRRGASLTQANLLGFGDSLTFSYTNTDGSNGIDANYTFPLNARNGTLSLAYGNTSSEVIEDPFNVLDIQSSSRYFDITLRQPVFQTPTQEFVLGLIGSRRESDTSILDDLPFPLSPGADDEGRTRLTALRFFQEWTQRSAQEVIALRSQFSLGLDAFNATVNETIPETGEQIPDSRFFSWRGQAQWVRLLAPDTLFLLRGDIQLADQFLLPIEQYGLGGLGSVRGYRQDLLLADNGALVSAELRLPIVRIPQWQGVLQVIPFFDVGAVWNSGREDPETDHLAALGLGLQWQQGDRFTARLDWGIPLVSVDSRERTWQENGLYFSITVNPF